MLERSDRWLGLARVSAGGRLGATAGTVPTDLAEGELASRPSQLRLADGRRAPALWMPVAGSGGVVNAHSLPAKKAFAMKLGFM